MDEYEGWFVQLYFSNWPSGSGLGAFIHKGAGNGDGYEQGSGNGNGWGDGLEFGDVNRGGGHSGIVTDHREDL